MFKVLFFIFGLISAISSQCTPTCIPPGRCDAYGGKPVFGLLDGFCRVYKNNCIFENEQCMRINGCQSQIMPTSKANCQVNCEPCYNVPSAPICALFLNREADGSITQENIDFGNGCKAREYACMNARAYVSTRSGPC